MPELNLTVARLSQQHTGTVCAQSLCSPDCTSVPTWLTGLSLVNYRTVFQRLIRQLKITKLRLRSHRISNSDTTRRASFMLRRD